MLVAALAYSLLVGDTGAAGLVLFVVGVVALVSALALRVALLVPVAIAAAGVAYALVIVEREAVDGAASTLSACLLIAAELAYLSLSFSTTAVEPEVLARAVMRTLLLGALAWLLGLFIVGLAQVPGRTSLTLELLGAAAVVVILGIAALLARRGPRRGSGHEQ